MEQKAHSKAGKGMCAGKDKIMVNSIYPEATVSGSKSGLCHLLPENDFFMPQFSHLYNGDGSNSRAIIKIE